MPSWERALNRISEVGASLAAIKHALEPIIFDNHTNARNVAYIQVDRLDKLASKLSETGSLIKEIKDEHELQLQSLTRLYDAKLLKVTSEKNVEIDRLRKKLAGIEPTAEQPPAPVPGYPPKGDSETNDTPNERTARDLIDAGRSAFNECRYQTASQTFQQAQRLLDSFTPERRKRFNVDEIAYYFAACSAQDSALELAARKARLVRFTTTYRNSQHLHSSQQAHANHLLAQLHVQSGDLSSAEASANTSAVYTMKLPYEDQRRCEQHALAMRINDLKGDGEIVNAVLAKRIPSAWREWFKGKYAPLQPKGAKQAPSEPLSRPPEGIARAPTWSIPQLVEKVSPPTELHPNASTRESWLQELNIDVRADYRAAIARSDKGEVQKLLRANKTASGALHVAALFNEVEIAKILLEAGSNINATCRMVRLTENPARPDGWVYTLTPLHVAIGAHQREMVRFLKQQGASLGIPQRSSQDPHKAPMAPARFLLSKGWLRMSRCEDVKEVAATLDVLTAQPGPWDINARLNERERTKPKRTLMDFAKELDDGVFKKAVVDLLQRRGAVRGKLWKASRSVICIDTNATSTEPLVAHLK